jgi:hypothetical protein
MSSNDRALFSRDAIFTSSALRLSPQPQRCILLQRIP